MRKDNLFLIAVDSLWADHMSGYGYPRLTTPHIDRFATQGVLFERNYSPHIPTTSAYATMLTGMDCFSHQVVALRHQGGLTDRDRTLPEILKEQGYNTTCVGFSGNPSSRGFDSYFSFPVWGSWKERPSRLVDAGHTVLLIEHQMDVIKTADHVIDLGPDGGHAGGEVVATGTPEEIAACERSHTGRFLRSLFQ